MKVIIDSENMTLDYEPLEKGAEVDVPAGVAKVWMGSGRAHRPGEKAASTEEGKTEPQSTADKSASTKRTSASNPEKEKK